MGSVALDTPCSLRARLTGGRAGTCVSRGRQSKQLLLKYSWPVSLHQLEAKGRADNAVMPLVGSRPLMPT